MANRIGSIYPRLLCCEAKTGQTQPHSVMDIDSILASLIRFASNIAMKFILHTRGSDSISRLSAVSFLPLSFVTLYQSVPTRSFSPYLLSACLYLILCVYLFRLIGI